MTAPGFAEANAFVTVLEQKSFTRAAKQLGLSLPRVSELVRNLEERLGVRLVERTTRSVSPTIAGEHLLQRLRPVLDDYRAALESTNEFRDKPAGLLRLTVAPPAADSALEPAVSSFLALYPEISLDISVDSGLVDIVAGRFDAGIRAGQRLERDMIAVRISNEIPGVVVASPRYLAEHGEPRTPQELAEHNCFSVRLPNGATIPWRFHAKGRPVEAHVDGRLTVNTATMQVRAAVEGMGLFQATREMVAPELAAGRLVTVLDEWAPPPVDGFFLYYPSRRQMRPALKALVDFLRERRR
ncbi:LysR family transcriptional regulator [Phyllobacterium phragmitis]|uniref:LysR family transcriptional regulator n=1 Tax=Phyllobacterium phragmitis TaxID=2670329 RepID=A0A2S9IRC7_9HYPH|nr:LysR family transcriptional regulator [Phyllobacterium phragmitis]PRD43084.1 LysR family transcriptional regulator [Phyllobacterium phragmitis]